MRMRMTDATEALQRAAEGEPALGPGVVRRPVAAYESERRVSQSEREPQRQPRVEERRADEHRRDRGAGERLRREVDPEAQLAAVLAEVGLEVALEREVGEQRHGPVEPRDRAPVREVREH